MKSSILVVGLGRSGIAAAKLLNAEGRKVIVLETKSGAKFESITEELKAKGILIELGKPLEIESFNPFLDEIDSIVISPGIPWNHPTLNELRKLGIAILGEVALAWCRLKHLKWIGITGTNGKTTVTHLLKHVLEQNGLNAPMGGNMGIAASELAIKLGDGQMEQPDWIIMELSSYQIEAASEVSPEIGIWTNLTPDHLERHGTLDAYRAIKRSLLARSKTRIFNADDQDLTRHRKELEFGKWVSTKGEGNKPNLTDFWIDNKGMIFEKGFALFSSSVLGIPGEHNLQNMLLVIAAARQIGLPAKAIEAGIKTFKGVPHRLEKIGLLQGVEIFNDSKATNFESATMGLKAIPGPVVVLAGGQVKQGASSIAWLQQLNDKACGVVLFGEGAFQLKQLIKSTAFNGEIFCCEGLNKAVDLAISLSRKKSPKSLLLSPACASFDQYQDFAERGDHFRKLIAPMVNKELPDLMNPHAF